MSTGGNVPTQGVVVEEAVSAKRRNTRGELGEGTRGGRVKAAWRSYKRETKKEISLREWARKALKSAVAASRIENVDDAAEIARDIAGWLDVKTHVHTAAQKKLMKEAIQRKRPKPKKPSKDRRRVKGNSGKR